MKLEFDYTIKNFLFASQNISYITNVHCIVRLYRRNSLSSDLYRRRRFPSQLINPKPPSAHATTPRKSLPTRPDFEGWTGSTSSHLEGCLNELLRQKDSRQKQKGPIGVEPMTYWAAINCSATELRTLVVIWYDTKKLVSFFLRRVVGIWRC